MTQRDRPPPAREDPYAQSYSALQGNNSPHGVLGLMQHYKKLHHWNAEQRTAPGGGGGASATEKAPLRERFPPPRLGPAASGHCVNTAGIHRPRAAIQVGPARGAAQRQRPDQQ